MREVELEKALEGEEKNVVVLSPHPDDSVIGMGGTIKRLLDGGCSVKVVVVTTGERGSPEAMENESARKELAEIRREEERDASRFLGYESVALSFHSAEGEEVAERIREETAGADIVFAPHENDGHHTHLDVTRQLLSLPPEAEVWGYETWRPISDPDVTVDISGEVEAKVEAIMCHRSQILQKDFAGAAKGLARYRGVFSKNYPKSGYDYAECFKVMST